MATVNGVGVIGCISLVQYGQMPDTFIGIKCAKGRGYILPGGKCGPEETYKECAARELLEETGLVAAMQNLVFHAPCAAWDVSYCFCFATEVEKLSGMKGGPEGDVAIVTWDMLLASKYKAYYELLQEKHAALVRINQSLKRLSQYE